MLELGKNAAGPSRKTIDSFSDVNARIPHHATRYAATDITLETRTTNTRLGW